MQHFWCPRTHKNEKAASGTSALTVQLEQGTFPGPGLLLLLLVLLRAPLKTMRQRQDGVCPTTTEPIETVYG